MRPKVDQEIVLPQVMQLKSKCRSGHHEGGASDAEWNAAMLIKFIWFTEVGNLPRRYSYFISFEQNTS